MTDFKREVEIIQKKRKNALDCHPIDYLKVLEADEILYKLYCDFFGEEHPDTLVVLADFSNDCIEVGDFQKALEFTEKIYAIKQKTSFEDYEMLELLYRLAYLNRKLGKYKKALEIKEKLYKLRCKVQGEEHSDSLKTLADLVYSYGRLNECEKMLEANEKLYALQCKLYGEKQEDTLITLEYLIAMQSNINRALELAKTLYNIRLELLGVEHIKTQEAFKRLQEIKAKFEKQ